MSRVWEAVPATYKAAAAIIGAVLFGIAVGNWFGAQSLLPQQVKALQDTTRVHSSRIDALDRKASQMVCLQISQLEATPWQRCLQ